MIGERPDAIGRRSGRIAKGRSRRWEWRRVRRILAFIFLAHRGSEFDVDILW